MLNQKKKLGRPKIYLTEEQRSAIKKQQNDRYYAKIKQSRDQTKQYKKIFQDRLSKINEMYININRFCCDCLTQKHHELTAPYCPKCWESIENGEKKINISELVPMKKSSSSNPTHSAGTSKSYSFGCNCEGTFCHC